MHRVIKYTKFMSILSTRENHTQTAVHPSLTELGSVFCPSLLHLGGIRLVCLWVGIRLVWPAAESQSPGYRSVCETHGLTHLGPHPRRCPGEWTPHPEKPQNIKHLDHIVTQFHTLIKQLYHFTSAYTTSHVAIQDTLIKSPA